MNCPPPPVVTIKDNQAFANSRDVSAYFGKRHDNVLADIRNTQEALSPEMSGVLFKAVCVNQTTGFGVRKVPSYDMTKDGFTLLVMSYTGKKALGCQFLIVSSSLAVSVLRLKN